IFEAPAGIERARIDDITGNFGIGVTHPNTMLHVDGTGVDNDGSTAVVRIISGNGAQNLLLDGNEIDAKADGLFLNNNTNENVILANGGGKVGIGVTHPATALDVAGTTRTRVLEITGGADLSEHFEIKEIEGSIADGGPKQARPGMAVSIDPDNPGSLVVSVEAYDHRVAGVISGAGGLDTGLLMSQSGSVANGQHAVAIIGRVYALADASYSPIQPGDLLTTSDTPGHVMKVTEYENAEGAIIGKAMTPLSEGRGLVLTLIGLQ
ncbi:MAG: hypothetical protein ACE5Q6_21965, partial [Dehalococcoidia bacterium]